ncbi:MAG: GNAT family N-acetyltransferase, partial [Candidatus Heimdallarchaeota archaeon]|nr:GNAT family N-acetyltransferase [Candidatus Heimdallarchaeota archaeon]
MRIRKSNPKDCQAINQLMELLIDELYQHESEDIRKILRANFTQLALKELCEDHQAHIYVAVKDNQITAFLFGWEFHNVFTIYWIYCLKAFRQQGIIKKLLSNVEERLCKKGIFKLEMYTYAEKNAFLDYCSKLGFKKGVLIKKSMFGFKIQKLYKYLGENVQGRDDVRIKIIGEAGQGVKLMSYTLASILAQLQYEVSVSIEYDSAVRGGVISADLIYSEQSIENPFIEEADVMIKFIQTRDWFPARNLIIDESICGTKSLECTIKTLKGTAYGFKDVAISKFGNKIYINMIALG